MSEMQTDSIPNVVFVDFVSMQVAMACDIHMVTLSGLDPIAIRKARLKWGGSKLEKDRRWS